MYEQVNKIACEIQQGDNGSPTDPIFVDDGGKVGIGTTSPSQDLEISDFNESIIKLNVTNGQSSHLHTGAASTVLATTSWLQFHTDSDLNGSSPSGERVRITRNGNVGIGTTTPQGKLDVNGSIYQSGVELHADYVFEPDFQLESIEEHSEFMWKNKHLKAIPKAKVNKNGLEVVEVGAHRKGIVEELEKAHIYIEQLHQHNKELEERLSKLEKRLNPGQ